MPHSVQHHTSTRPKLADTATLRSFIDEYGKTARAGLLLHAGTAMEWLAPNVLQRRGGG